MTLEVVELGASLSTCTLLNWTLQNWDYANNFPKIRIKEVNEAKLQKGNLISLVFIGIIRISRICNMIAEIFSLSIKESTFERAQYVVYFIVYFMKTNETVLTWINTFVKIYIERRKTENINYSLSNFCDLYVLDWILRF